MTTIPVPTQENTFIDDKGVTHWKPEAVKTIIDTLKDKPAWVDSDGGMSIALVVEAGSSPPQGASVEVYDKFSEALEKESSSLHGGQLLLVASTASVDSIVKELYPTAIAVFRYMGKEDSKLVEESQAGPVADIAEVDRALGGVSNTKMLTMVAGAAVAGILLSYLLFRKK